MAVALMFGATSVFAQKFARIDYQGIIFSMPEMTGVQEGYTKAETEYRDHLEGLSVEANRKMDEFQKLPEGTTETVRQLKQREIIEIQQRHQEYLQLAQEGLEQTRMELMTPLQQKADAAIQKICKAQGIVAVFQKERMGADLVYLDESQAADITEAVCKELGVTFPLATSAPAAQ